MIIIEKVGRRSMYLIGLALIIINNYAYFFFDEFEIFDTLKFLILSFKFILGMVKHYLFKKNNK